MNQNKGIKKVNLGCGTFKLDGYINIDIRERVGPDIVADVLKGLPFKDGEVDEVSCTELLEHFTPEENEIALKEINRILKKGGIFRFGLPAGIRCSLDLFREFSESDTLENIDLKTVKYRIQNIAGAAGREKIKKIEGTELGKAIIHQNLFNEQYLTLLLEKHGFKNIKFGEHMSAYEKWKEKYKIIGKAEKIDGGGGAELSKN